MSAIAVIAVAFLVAVVAFGAGWAARNAITEANRYISPPDPFPTQVRRVRGPYDHETDDREGTT